jgi:hypothetical protein
MWFVISILSQAYRSLIKISGETPENQDQWSNVSVSYDLENIYNDRYET